MIRISLATGLLACALAAQVHAGGASVEERRSPGKPTAPVELEPLSIALAPGVVGAAQLAIRVGADLDALALSVLPSAGVAARPAGVTRHGPLRAGQLVTLPVEIRADQAGGWHLNLLAETWQGPVYRARALATVVSVGHGRRAGVRNGKLLPAADGQPVVSLPAYETARQTPRVQAAAE